MAPPGVPTLAPPTAPPNLRPPPERPMRCRRCYYVLEHLPEQRCPECGTDFDPADPTTYVTRPPFVFWQYWLPGFALAVGVGAVEYAILALAVGYGFATTVAVPLRVGTLLGYGVRGALWLKFLLAVVAAGAVVTGLVMAGQAVTDDKVLYAVPMLFAGVGVGLFCGSILLAIALVPITIGAGAGAYLRHRLKRSAWAQSPYLPIVIALVPLVAAVAEGRIDGLKVVSLDTVAVIDAPPDRAWEAVQFYEEVAHRPPLLLRLSPSLRPLYTSGESAKVGDVKVCVYERGRLAKRVTAVEPGRRLAFSVVEQTDIEDRSVRLVGGSFVLEPIDGGRRTRVRLTTSYQPELRPRLAWGPAEALAVHTLHGHVLEGMRRRAEGATGAGR